MLHLSTVDSKTLGLLKLLQEITFFDEMRLVGGTALALQMGHRQSIDIDLYFLLQDFSLREILAAYEKKYHDGNIFMAVKSLIYFADAEEEQMPFMLKNVEWETVKSNIKMHLDNYTKQQ